MTTLGCGREDITQYAPTESFPNDSTLIRIENQKAMVITAHDDDMCAMAGTIAHLNQAGWEIVSVFFKNKDVERNRAHKKATKDLLDSVIVIDLKEQIRKKIDPKVKAYEAVSKNNFGKIYNYPKITRELLRIINGFAPEVIFTLDNEIGGYGHPDHVFISQLVLDLAISNSISPGYIYQNVYTDHMETSIMQRHARRMKSWGYPGNGWEKAKAIYQVQGMPDPTVQINIKAEAKSKMKFLLSYNERERKTMGFYIPAFEDYTPEEYFSIFDREFFHVITFKK